MPLKHNDIGNFIDALLHGLELLAGLEDTYAHNESLKRDAPGKQRAMYIAIENVISDFEQSCGVSARNLLNQWNRTENGPSA